MKEFVSKCGVVVKLDLENHTVSVTRPGCSVEEFSILWNSQTPRFSRGACTGWMDVYGRNADVALHLELTNDGDTMLLEVRRKPAYKLVKNQGFTERQPQATDAAPAGETALVFA